MEKRSAKKYKIVKNKAILWKKGVAPVKKNNEKVSIKIRTNFREIFWKEIMEFYLTYTIYSANMLFNLNI